MKEMKILSPTAILGYGFPVESFEKAMALEPDVIAVDAGSTDPGPFYLGDGVSFTDRLAVKRDLTIMIKAALKAHIPLLIGSAGGSGADVHLLWCVEIVREILGDQHQAKVAVISAEVSKEKVHQALFDNQAVPLTAVPPLTHDDIENCTRIVAQMGLKPFIKALDMGADIIVAGRTYDPVAFAALAIRKGYDKGLALHLGKILECAAIAATPGSGSDCMMGCIGKDYFRVFPLNEKRRCTTLSVAAHTLYEKSDPYHLHGPDGVIDLSDCHFEQQDDRTVKITGTRFHEAEIPNVKLEGAKVVGFRTVSIAGIRDSILISQIDEVLEAVRETTKNNFAEQLTDYHLDFKVYGKNGVMGDLEPVRTITSHELGLIIDVVAKTQADANAICSFARSTMLHYGYKGRISTAGNLAFPYSPSDFKAGEVYEFCIYHLIPYEEDMFTISWSGGQS
ncbi:MAG: acyclic terpene utilization AtuA family protein [Clostridia bacterium]|nr:acyclic terpene utilization AtuA family protein [Clostridia bacterium]